jgi:predicted DNA binding CopG/RHH family protein
MKEYNSVKPLDKEEKELIESIKNDEWEPVKNMDEFKIQAKKYAESTIKKDKRMNIRISERDLKNLKIRALEDGIPYQTLVSMVLHKYLTGKYIEKVS